jgi:anti-sigma B factor antagonist
MNDMINVVHLGSQVLMVEVRRDIDWATASRFRDRMQAIMQGARGVLCCLPQGRVVDSSGLMILGMLQTRAMSTGTAFALVCDDLNQRRIFKMTGLDDFVPIHHTVAEGLSNVLLRLAA